MIPRPTPRPLSTAVYHTPHAPDPTRRVCLEWRLAGERPVYWYYPSEGEARQAEAGLRVRPVAGQARRLPA